MRPTGLRVFSFVLWTALFSQMLHAQVGNASVAGTVQDSTGAIISGAQVTATNMATGVARKTTTTPVGLYLITDLIPGTYSIKVTAPGFKTHVISDIGLRVDQRAQVDVALEVGNLSQEVTVSGSALPLLQTEEASVGKVVENAQVVNLPLNGRYFTQLLELAPGTAPPPPSTQTTSYVAPTQRNQIPTFNVSGQTGAYTMYRIDGIDAAEHNFGGAALPMSVDAIQEFRVQTSNFSAQYGRSAIQVDLVTKSGTNAYHGDLFEFVRNDALGDANNWSFTGPHSPLGLKRNQFGGTFGGPIKKDKLFFFTSYDGTRLVHGSPQTVTVPSNEMRNGIFPSGVVIYDPTSGLPFPNNTIPGARWNPISVKVLNVLPAPNLPGVAQTNASGLALPPINNYFYNPQLRQTINQYNGRLDYTMSEKNSFSARYTYSSNDIIADGPVSAGLQNSIVGAQAETFGAQNFGASWVHSFSPTTMNEVLLGILVNPDSYSKVITPQTPSADTLGMGQFLAPGYAPGMPDFKIGNVRLGSGDYRPLQYGDTNYFVNDNATLVRGKHTLQIGGGIQRTVLQEQDGEVSDGRFFFNGAQTRNRATPGASTTPCGPGGTQTCQSGNAMADFLLGYLQSAGRGTAIPFMPKYFSVWSGYIEDTWKVAKNFTLNLGLRYDYNARFHVGGNHPNYYATPIIANGEFTGKVAVANDSSGNISRDVLPQAVAAFPGVVESCKQAGLPNNCMISEKHDIQPRFGFAYSLNNKTVLRGGFGIFYGYLEGYVETEQGDQWPMVEFRQTQSYTRPPSGLTPPPLTLSDPFATAAAAAPSFNNNGPAYRPLQSTYEWNVTLQRELMSNTTLSLGYVASVSRHIENASNNQGYCCWYNIPEPIGVVLAPNQSQQPYFPRFGAMTSYGDNANASYESLQVSLVHRTSHGLTFTGNYTFSKNLWIQPWLTDPRDPAIDRGPWDGDVRHYFVFSPVWQVPLGAGQRWANVTGPLNLLIGGWQVSSVISIRSGFPFTPTLSGTDLLNMNGYNAFDVPDRVAGCNLGTQTLGNWFNKNCFAVPAEPTTPGALLREGNAGINELRGPGGWSVDLGLSKFIPVTERYRIEFRAEAFNLFNHPVFGQPNVSIEPGGNSGAALISGVVSEPRIIQLALKLHF